MNDDFLYQLHEEPAAEFAQKLRQELNHFPFATLRSDPRSKLFMGRHPVIRRMAWGLAALILTFALVLAVSPTVRAAVIDIIETITLRGATVWVSDDVPAIRGESEIYAEIWTPLSPGEIAANHPVFAKLPTWAPSGYELQERAALFASVNREQDAYSVLYEWKNQSGGILQLKITKGSCPNGQLWESGASRSDCTHMMYVNVGLEGRPESVTINDQPALLFPGFQMLMDLSDPIRKWNPDRVKYDNRDPEAFFLIWEADGMTFEIASKSWTITKKDLIRFAESIP